MAVNFSTIAIGLSLSLSLSLSLHFPILPPSFPPFLPFSLPLSLTHTYTHTHTLVGISSLEQLEYLDVSSNQLSRLCTDLKDLHTLQTFIVSDNPLESPPMQVCGSGFVW